MTRRFFILAATFCALMPGASISVAEAQTVQLGPEEVERLLNGNTVEGDWDGAAYKSWFGPDGTTIFAPANGDPLQGKWRVNFETGEYESFFDAVGWTGYTVLRTDTGFAWLKDGKTYAFNVIEGRTAGF